MMNVLASIRADLHRRVAIAVLLLAGIANAADATITVHADQTLPRAAGPLRSGVCLEDVNHEIYGGLYSQMLFGESFQELPPAAAPAGFLVFGGAWRVEDGTLSVDAADGPKCVSDGPRTSNGSVRVRMKFDDRSGENAGLLLRVNGARDGADAFVGYEVSVDPVRQVIRVGRHENDFKLLQDAPADIPVGRWFTLAVTVNGRAITTSVDGQSTFSIDDPTPLPAGTIGLRTWRQKASYRDLAIDAGDGWKLVPFVAPTTGVGRVSGQWRPVVRGNADADFSLPRDDAFVGPQSQRITFRSGGGEAGVENRGLNRAGLTFMAGKPYEGCVWLKAGAATTVAAALENPDGKTAYARQTFDVQPGTWQKIDLNLTPIANESAGRFTLSLTRPGTVTLGYAFLQPGAWGRFKNLPVRRDVVEGLLGQGVGVIRYGGSMVNDEHYRWKQMIGPREKRPPYHGNWYPHSTNGWGMIDFLNLAEAMGVEGIPDLNVNESPQDIVDFIDYVNGPADSGWGRRRAADGHPAPYGIRHLQLGNEERVDRRYAEKFVALAQAVWAKDKQIVLVVGDFGYKRPITDPDGVRGADGGITNLDGQRMILQFARSQGREVWFDVHVWSERPEPSDDLKALPSYIDALEKLADGAKHRVVVFELNANSHGVGRALANAASINTIRRDGRVPIVISANALQPDGQNDNGWDQGLLFLTPAKVWLQPPGYVTQMQAADLKNELVKADIAGAAARQVDATASRSADGNTLTLQLVNTGEAVDVAIDLGTFAPKARAAGVTELAGEPHAANTADRTDAVTPRRSQWPIAPAPATLTRRLPAHGFTVIRFD